MQKSSTICVYLVWPTSTGAEADAGPERKDDFPIISDPKSAKSVYFQQTDNRQKSGAMPKTK